MVYPLITLYSSTETKFETNGLGSLSEAISCKVVEEANGSFELEMEYPIYGKRYKDIQIRSILYVKPNPVDPPQAFRVYKITKPMTFIVTYYAAHISYDLSGYPLEPFEASSCVAAMAGLKTHSIFDNPFEFYTDKSTNGTFNLTNPLPIRSALGGVEGSILDIYHGEYKFDNFTVNLYNHRGMDRGVVIRYGKNLTDLEQEENNSKVYTAVMPYWQSFDTGEVVMLSEKYIEVEGNFGYTNVLVEDFSADFEEKPTEDQLREKTKSYIQNNDIGKPDISIDVSFVQLEQTEEYKNLALLERVELFDTVTVEFPEMEISATAKVSKTEYNVLTGKYDSVTLGSIRANISSTIAEQDGAISEAIDDAKDQIKSDLEKATENATNWITNGRGYMVAIKNENNEWMEICSLDTKDINAALHVWRWNNGGFGHSSHGYNGPYDTAITQDGKINANFITTGSLNANIVTTGLMQSKNGKVYFDLDGNELCCDTLKSSKPFTSTTGSDPQEIFVNIGYTPYSSGRYYSQAQIYRNNYQNQGVCIDPYPSTAGASSSTYSAIYTLSNGLEVSSRSVRGIPAQESILHLEYSDVAERVPYAALLVGTTSGENYGVSLTPSSISIDTETGGYVDVYGNTSIHGSFIVHNSSKSRAVTTKNYSDRLQYCYEMPTPMFGDIGEGITDDYGECYIYFDDVFAETISAKTEYQVFLQKESKGDIRVSEKTQLYFVVKGDKNVKFAWEIKAKQLGYEYERLDEYVREKKENQIDYFGQYLNEIEELIKEREGALYETA